MEKIEVVGNQVRYQYETNWERRTLLANQFKEDKKDTQVMVSNDPNAKGVADLIKSGGSSGLLMNPL